MLALCPSVGGALLLRRRAFRDKCARSLSRVGRPGFEVRIGEVLQDNKNPLLLLCEFSVSVEVSRMCLAPVARNGVMNVGHL